MKKIRTFQITENLLAGGVKDIEGIPGFHTEDEFGTYRGPKIDYIKKRLYMTENEYFEKAFKRIIKYSC